MALNGPSFIEPFAIVGGALNILSNAFRYEARFPCIFLLLSTEYRAPVYPLPLGPTISILKPEQREDLCHHHLVVF